MARSWRTDSVWRTWPEALSEGLTYGDLRNLEQTRRIALVSRQANAKQTPSERHADERWLIDRVELNHRAVLAGRGANDFPADHPKADLSEFPLSAADGQPGWRTLIDRSVAIAAI